MRFMGYAAHVLSALRAASRNRNVRSVELAWGGAIAAEWAHFVALGVFAYRHGGTAAVGVAGVARLLPAAAIAPVAASLGDRFRRERFLLAIAIVGASALGLSALGAATDDRVLVLVAAAVMGVSTTLFRPALQALLPSLAHTPQELIAANGSTSIVESVGALAGPLLAGAIVAIADVGAVFAAGAGLFLAAAGVMLRVRVEGRVPLESSASTGARIQAAGAGFRAIAGNSHARLIVALAIAQTFVRGCLNVLIVVAVFRVLDGDAAHVGYLTAAIGCGGLIGALGAMTLETRRLAVPFGLALVFWGAPVILIAPASYTVAAAFLLALVGAANSVEDVALFTLLQRLVPDAVLTRVLGAFWGLAMGAVAVGSIVAPAIVDALGPKAAFVVVGSVLPLLSVLTFSRLAEIDRSVAPVPELALLDDVPMFAPLSIAMKERIAANLTPVLVPAGAEVIRAGEAGDRFYIVDGGELSIDSGVMHLSAAEGDYFGEIALLHDVPRTATVTAITDARLYALQRGAFLEAVTGHSAADAAGRRISEARLDVIARQGR
jgi:MFS family permease